MDALAGRLLLVASGLMVAALALADPAFAHAGKGAPVATNFEAEISGVKPATGAVEVKVVDGDRELWLHATGNATVLVPGIEGEPVLRFAPAGVFVNLRSLTAASDRIDSSDLRPVANPHAPPLWHRLTLHHSYRWHEHRLHALEPLARGRETTTVVGHWSVPLLIDGRPHSVEGALVYRPPGAAWPWILLACALAAVLSVTRALPTSVVRRVAVGAALVGALLVWTVRIGRELYGRPSIAVTGYVEIALTSLVGLALLYGLLHRDRAVRLFTAWLLSFGCIYQGLTMLPVITHSVALSVLPSPVSRVAVPVIFGIGAGLLAITMREQFAGAPAARQVAVESGSRPLRRA
jgi:hypothetical protein